MTVYLYQPANGTEGMVFESHHCARCVYDRDDLCGIHDRAMVFEPGDDEYPEEWRYDDEGRPTCTRFATEIPPPTRAELEQAGQSALPLVAIEPLVIEGVTARVR